MKRLFRLYCPLILPLIFFFSISTAQKFSPSIDKLQPSELLVDSVKISTDSLILTRERILLHIANEYVGNDNVFFKGYLLSGLKQNRYGLSGVLNVELLNGNGVVLKKQFYKIVNGMVEGNLQLPKSIRPGRYYIRAYTRWMQNYGEELYAQKEIWVGELLSETPDYRNVSDVLIVPEGGTLLNGYNNRLVVKIPYTQAEKMGKVGRILDDRNIAVAKVNIYSTGVGTTIFKPIKGRNYLLELEDGSSYPIPKVKDQGYLLHVNNLDTNSAKIKVTASSENLGRTVKLVGTINSISYFENELNFGKSNIANIEIVKRDIPNGTLVLKLIDTAGTILAMRPIWIDGERLNINISPIALKMGMYGYKIKVTDKTNSPIKTQLALSVNRYEGDSKLVFDDFYMEHSNLFKIKEIPKGDSITQDRSIRFCKDLSILMYSADVENNFSNKNRLESDKKFSIQKGLELAGYAYNLNNEVLSNTKIQIMALSDDEMWIKETKTDINGFFKLEEMDINGRVTLVSRTKGSDTKSRLVKIKPVKKWEPETNSYSSKDGKKQQQDHIFESTDWQPIDNTGIIELNEVTIMEKALKKRNQTPSVHGIDIVKTRIKYQDPNKPRSIAQMLQEIPGVTVANGIGEMDGFVTIHRASGPVLWVIDGFTLAQGESGLRYGGPVPNPLRDISTMVNAIDVERIELLIGPDAAFYGTRGSGGVFLIYTRSAKDLDLFSRKEGQFVFQGFEPVLKFESYQQDLSKKEKKNSNILFWNPELETDENGEAIIRVPASLDESVIKIEASAITTDGKIGFLRTIF